jgi:hypothetical protein
VLGEVEKCLGRGESVMLLASCSYMLAPVITLLRKSGLPFGNPYRLANSAWNPIRPGRPGAASNRILALLAAHPVMGADLRPWTYADVKLWAEWLTSKGIPQQGAKKLLGCGTRFSLGRPLRRPARPSWPCASSLSRQRRIVRSLTPMISAACHHASFFAMAVRSTSCHFIIRSTSAAGISLRAFTPPASPFTCSDQGLFKENQWW